MCPHLLCCHSRLEWEQLLEQHRTLQDSFDQLQAEAKFEADQAGHQIDDLKAQLTVSQLDCGHFILKCRDVLNGYFLMIFSSVL